ncbi:MAG: hypothetical protein QOG53_1859 [Frankiales bacterium]|jgi:hypothetical protein|nr:hypothetical protein [Frankiales bacterium]
MTTTFERVRRQWCAVLLAGVVGLLGFTAQVELQATPSPGGSSAILTAPAAGQVVAALRTGTEAIATAPVQKPSLVGTLVGGVGVLALLLSYAVRRRTQPLHLAFAAYARQPRAPPAPIAFG